VLYPDSFHQVFCGPDRCFAISADTFVNSDGNETDILPGTEKAVEEQEESGAVLAAAQGYRHAVARHDLLTAGDRSGNPLFNISDKVGAA
jgi:hypothetical protein